MRIHRPPCIPELPEKLSAEEREQLLGGMQEYEKRKIPQNQMQRLRATEPYYPVIPVDGQYILLAVSKSTRLELIWLCSWFQVDSAYRDRNNVYRVELNINGRLVTADYDMLYPKDVIKLSRYGLLMDPDHADSLSRYLFRRIAKLEVREQFGSMGFVMQNGELRFRAYEKERRYCSIRRASPCRRIQKNSISS